MANTLTLSKSLHIGGITIHQDQNGRFSLNDLHQAAGGEAKFGPGRFTRTSAFKDLADAIRAEISTPEQGDCLKIDRKPEMAFSTDADCPSTDQTPDLVFGRAPVDPVQVIKGGPNQGTYVARELVYAYAMWISPAFNLRVIRTFDALMMGRIQAIRDDAQKAIEAVEKQAFARKLPAKELKQHEAAVFEILDALRREHDPEKQKLLYRRIKLYYHAMGEPLPPLDALGPRPLMIETGPSREAMGETIEAQNHVIKSLVSALRGLVAASRPHLLPDTAEEMPEALRCAAAAIKLAQKINGGAA